MTYKDLFETFYTKQASDCNRYEGAYTRTHKNDPLDLPLHFGAKYICKRVYENDEDFIIVVTELDPTIPDEKILADFCVNDFLRGLKDPDTCNLKLRFYLNDEDDAKNEIFPENPIIFHTFDFDIDEITDRRDYYFYCAIDYDFCSDITGKNI